MWSAKFFWSSTIMPGNSSRNFPTCERSFNLISVLTALSFLRERDSFVQRLFQWRAAKYIEREQCRFGSSTDFQNGANASGRNPNSPPICCKVWLQFVLSRGRPKFLPALNVLLSASLREGQMDASE